MNAWLITWEWIGDHAEVEDPIAAIINYRRSSEYVREVTEFLYVNSQFSLGERVGYAKTKATNPYPASYDTMDGEPLGGRIHCGHNPYLYARMVENLHAEVDESGEQLRWQERPLPTFLRSGPSRPASRG